MLVSRDSTRWGAFFVALALAPSAALANETHVYGIAQFGGAGQCGDIDDTHTVHTTTAGAFLAPFTIMTAFGRWSEAYARNDTSARGSYFTDASQAATCACTADDLNTDDGTDDADVIYVHTHGGRTTSSPYYTQLLMGNSSYACLPRTDNNMLFGNGSGDLEIAVIKACQSGDYNVWQNAGYRQQFNTSSGTFTVWNAFHGDSSCGSWVTTYVSDYAWSSEYDGVGENWMDAAYDNDSGSNTDDCPVSIVMGSTSSLREHMYEYGGWNDRENTGSKTGSTYYYFSGCDPDNGVVLP